MAIANSSAYTKFKKRKKGQHWIQCSIGKRDESFTARLICVSIHTHTPSTKHTHICSSTYRNISNYQMIPFASHIEFTHHIHLLWLKATKSLTINCILCGLNHNTQNKYIIKFSRWLKWKITMSRYERKAQTPTIWPCLYENRWADGIIRFHFWPVWHKVNQHIEQNRTHFVSVRLIQWENWIANIMYVSFILRLKWFLLENCICLTICQ